LQDLIRRRAIVVDVPHVYNLGLVRTTKAKQVMSRRRRVTSRA
jgi:hypothetical protein